MHLSLNQPFACIKSLNEFELPEFAVLIGKNGVGKTRLLSGIQDGSIAVSGLPREDIEFYNFTSFRSGDSGTGSWEASGFHRQVVERYFAPSAGSPLVEVAERVFQETLDRFELSHDDERRREFVEAILRKIRSLPDFEILGTFGSDDAVTSYSQALQQQVLNPLDSGSQKRHNVRNRPPNGVGHNQAALVSLAMKLGRKLPHELDRSDFLRASNYEGGTIRNTLSELFTRYKVDQCHWALIEAEESDKSFRALMREYREAEPPPWENLRTVLDRMRDTSTDPGLFNFEFSDPEQDSLNYRNHDNYSFTAQFTNRSTGESYSTKDLSSGENILLSMCFAAYHKAMGRRQPGLLLLDEVDAVLHPSMISALIAGLREQFVDNGTAVIMATHSVTTASLVDEDAIFRVSRSGGRVNVFPGYQIGGGRRVVGGPRNNRRRIENRGVGEHGTHYHHVGGEEYAAPQEMGWSVLFGEGRRVRQVEERDGEGSTGLLRSTARTSGNRFALSLRLGLRRALGRGQSSHGT